MSGSPIEPKYIKSEGRAGRMGARLMAVVAEGQRGRVYLPPTADMEEVAAQAKPDWKPETSLPHDPRNFWTVDYGLKTYGDLFTPRQLTALNTFSDLVLEAREKVIADAKAAGWLDDGKGLEAGGARATGYGDAVAVYLSLAVSKLSDAQSSLCRWKTTMDQSIATFGRQALPMVWDYSEANAFGGMAGDYSVSLKNMMRVLDRFSIGRVGGFVSQADAQSQTISSTKIVSTDPPYYDNIGYADLSDFFYVWLRRTLKSVLPELLSTLAVPKNEELVATPYRHGSKGAAEAFFLGNMKKAIHNLMEQCHPAFPVTIYYAFKQSETKGEDGTASTGWETFLEVISSIAQLTSTSASRSQFSGQGAVRTQVCTSRPTNEAKSKRRLTQYCASAR
jgi:putative DNA methylase